MKKTIALLAIVIATSAFASENKKATCHQTVLEQVMESKAISEKVESLLAENNLTAVSMIAAKASFLADTVCEQK